jgi:hypothetical protein
MKKILTVLAGGVLVGAFSASYGKLPPPTPEEKEAAAAKAQKAESEKAKAAKEVAQAQDRAVANYMKNKGKGSSSAGATAQPESRQASPAAQGGGKLQGADHSNAGMPDSDLTRHEAQTQMPKPGQVNDYSTPARDSQNSSGSR